MYAEKLKVKTLLRDAARKNFATSRQFCNSGHPVSDEDAFRWSISIALLSEVYKTSTLTLMALSEKVVDCSTQDAYKAASLARKGLRTLQYVGMHQDIKSQLDFWKACLMVLRHFDLQVVHGEGYRTISPKQYWARLRETCADYSLDRENPLWVHCVSHLFRYLCLINTPETFRELNTIFQFISRLTFHDCDWQLEEARTSYIEMEEQLHSQSYDQDVIAEMRQIANEWLKGIDVTVATGQHGYGATAEVKRSHGTDAKWHAMLSRPTKESVRVKQLLGWQPTENCWPGLAEMWDKTLHERTLDHVTQLVGQIQFVAKDALRKRTVSKEPTTNMFWQKMIFQILDMHYRKHPEMHIHLHDQEVNRRLALVGSRDGSFATIDLSNASDTVTRTLVMGILADQPKLRYLLFATRTSRVDLEDGTRVDLEKFAPMGSACCFPIECLIFSLVCELAARRRGVSAKERSSISVYGDDIVIPASLYDDVLALLVQLHFQPNATKSYGHSSRFTEACGMEAYHGVDVSPIRLSRHWDPVTLARGVYASTRGSEKNPLRKRKQHEQVIAGLLQCSSLTDLCNFACFAGQLRLRRHALHMIFAINENPVFDNTGNGGIFTTRPLEEVYFDRITFDKRTHQPCVVVTYVSAEKARGSEEASYSLNLEEISEGRVRSRALFPALPLELQDPSSAGAVRHVRRTCRIPLRNLQDPFAAVDSTVLDVWSRYKLFMSL